MLERHAAIEGGDGALLRSLRHGRRACAGALAEPPATLLVLPNGWVKVAAALPHVCADLRATGLAEAWKAYREAWHDDDDGRDGGARRSPTTSRHAGANALADDAVGHRIDGGTMSELNDPTAGAASPWTRSRLPRRARQEAALGNAQARGRLRAGDGAAVHPLHLRSATDARALGRRLPRAPVPRLAAHQPLPGALPRLLRGIRSRQGLARRARRATRRCALAQRIVDAGIPYRRLRRRRAARRCPSAGSSSRCLADGGRRAQDRDRRQPHRRRGRRPARGARASNACRSRSTARPPRRTSACVPGSSFAAAIGAIERLVARGVPPQFVFVPDRLNLHEIVAAYDLAARARLQRVRHGPADAHRPRRRRLGRASRCTRRRVAARGRGAARARASARQPDRARRSIRGTSSPRWRRASRARRRCCWSCRTAR